MSVMSISEFVTLLGESGINIIFAEPRKGKTSFMTAILNYFCYDKVRNKLQRKEVLILNNGGFDLKFPNSATCSNYDILFKKFRYSRIKTRRINPYRLGFFNDKVKTIFVSPYDVIGITEAQKYFNSRMSKKYPDWQSRFYEQCGHNYLLFFLDCQRPKLIDANIRDLSKFIEIVDLEKKYKGNKIVGLVWTIKLIENSSLLDNYLSNGKNVDFPIYKVGIDYNVFDLYNSRSSQPQFFKGHFDEQFVNENFEQVEKTKESFQKFLEKSEDVLPKGFYRE